MYTCIPVEYCELLNNRILPNTGSLGVADRVRLSYKLYTCTVHASTFYMYSSCIYFSYTCTVHVSTFVSISLCLSVIVDHLTQVMSWYAFSAVVNALPNGYAVQENP